MPARPSHNTLLDAVLDVILPNPLTTTPPRLADTATRRFLSLVGVDEREAGD